MAFEHIAILAEVTTEDGAQYAIITAVTAAATWISFNLVKPWFTDWLENKKLDREAKRKRDNDLVQTQIDEIKQKRIDDRDANEKNIIAMEARGARETSHITALNAVADGQRQNLLRLERMEEFTNNELKQLRLAVKAVLRRVDEDFEFDGDHNDGRSPPTTGQPTTGGTV
jgi:hypothetical protein